MDHQFYSWVPSCFVISRHMSSALSIIFLSFVVQIMLCTFDQVDVRRIFDWWLHWYSKDHAHHRCLQLPSMDVVLPHLIHLRQFIRIQGLPPSSFQLLSEHIQPMLDQCSFHYKRFDHKISRSLSQSILDQYYCFDCIQQKWIIDCFPRFALFLNFLNLNL